MESIELDRIVFLLTDDNYKDELKTFRRALQRFRVRLRNNRLSGDLKHVKTLIYRLEIDFPASLFQHYQSQRPVNKSLKTLRLRLNQYIHKLDVLISKATSVYGSSQPHFRVGHLVQHYLVIRASLARLIFCFKALLVYTVDLYSTLFKQYSSSKKSEPGKDDRITTINIEEAKNILIKHNCKPKQEVDSPIIIDQSPAKKIKLSDSVGQLIDRETMRPKRVCRKK